ncbi:MAG: hypothetical protein EBS07_08470 [Sphingobacteriia bacterium]|nr:hypothetical protein [Sphingobacteriia bacterium]
MKHKAIGMFIGGLLIGCKPGGVQEFLHPEGVINTEVKVSAERTWWPGQPLNIVLEVCSGNLSRQLPVQAKVSKIDSLNCRLHWISPQKSTLCLYEEDETKKYFTIEADSNWILIRPEAEKE